MPRKEKEIEEGHLPTGFHNQHEGEHHEKQIKWKDMDPTKFFILNAGANFVADAIIYPIDVIRTRMQVQGSSIVQTSFHKYNNSFHAFAQIVKSEGPRGLFKGFAVSETGYVAGHTVYYGVYEVLKQGLQNTYPCQKSKDPNFNVFWTTAVAGGAADLVACGLSVPSEVATTRLQIQGPLSRAKYSSGIDVLMQVYRAEGVRGLYRGLGATLLRNVPASAIWWGSYELTKNKLHAIDLRAKLGMKSRKTAGAKVENEDPLIHITAGIVAAIISTTVVNPIDIAKTRLQSTEVFLGEEKGGREEMKERRGGDLREIKGGGDLREIKGAEGWKGPHALPPSPPRVPLPTHPPSALSPISSLSPTLPRPTKTPLIPLPSPSLIRNLLSLTPRPTAGIASTIKGVLFAKHNTMSVLVMMVREEGFRSLGKGLFPSLLIATPYSVISILLYEEIKKWCVV